MKVAFLFAGQGVQYVGMGKELYEKSNTFKSIFDKLPSDVKDICFNGPEEDLNNTLNAQPAILATSYGIASVLKEKGIDCEFCAGLSLGEYSALTYSGVFNIDDVIEIVRQRGSIMADALPLGTTGMAAIINSDEETINDVINEYENLGIANYNSSKQIVITGDINSIDKAIEKFKELKVRAIKLNVSGAFHSSYLEDASVKLNEVLSNYEIKKPLKKVVFNVTGNDEDNDIKDLLTKQIKSSVLFRQSIEYMISKGVDTFIEIGPGKTLSGFVRATSKDVNVYQVETYESIEKVVDLLNE